STAASSLASGLHGPLPTQNLLIGHCRAAANDPPPVSDPKHVRQSIDPAKTARDPISDDLAAPANALHDRATEKQFKLCPAAFAIPPSGNNGDRITATISATSFARIREPSVICSAMAMTGAEFTLITRTIPASNIGRRRLGKTSQAGSIMVGATRSITTM